MIRRTAACTNAKELNWIDKPSNSRVTVTFPEAEFMCKVWLQDPASYDSKGKKRTVEELTWPDLKARITSSESIQASILRTLAEARQKGLIR